jgi:uncharacterized protein YeaC (DUF1315 family)
MLYIAKHNSKVHHNIITTTTTTTSSTSNHLKPNQYKYPDPIDYSTVPTHTL